MRRKTLTLYSEQWLMRRLRDHGVGVLDEGVTTQEERTERVREAILRVGPQVIVGRGKEGKPENYEQVFERLYGAPLQREVAA